MIGPLRSLFHSTAKLHPVLNSTPFSTPHEFLKWVSLISTRQHSQFATGFTPLQEKPLESIIDVRRAKDLSPQDLIKVWDDYHLGRSHIGTHMDVNHYNLLKQRATSCPYFVLPLRKRNGYTSIFMEAKLPHLLFTGLEDYKARGPQAALYFTLTRYMEFAESKGIVLVRGDIILTSKLSDSDAKWLSETSQSFYLDDRRYTLVEQFNRKSRDFEFKDVLQALDMPLC